MKTIANRQNIIYLTPFFI